MGLKKKVERISRTERELATHESVEYYRNLTEYWDLNHAIVSIGAEYGMTMVKAALYLYDINPDPIRRKTLIIIMKRKEISLGSLNNFLKAVGEKPVALPNRTYKKKGAE